MHGSAVSGDLHCITDPVGAASSRNPLKLLGGQAAAANEMHGVFPWLPLYHKPLRAALQAPL